MKKTSFSKFTNVESDPIILDFDSGYSAPRLANPLPQTPRKQITQISDTHCNIQYERRTKYKNESSGSQVAEHQRTMLLYLEGLRFDGVDVERGQPSICCWNASTMRLHEELEMASGPFGMGVIQDIVGREETQEV
ncbi:hypothetical protein L2E82_08253 [Cichorium intybus]|uniref:Uncharacterized protein n=1 Tax=Cichorium intybus TaxID=13427 RepID=A0ACB9G724_CICIN|nr:hypothetical protein L2E82_08253 [Cichorium intybus]